MDLVLYIAGGIVLGYIALQLLGLILAALIDNGKIVLTFAALMGIVWWVCR